MAKHSNAQTDEEVSDMQKVQDITERVSEKIQSELGDFGEQVRSRLESMNFNETTIPDAFRRVPKLISPRLHAWLDVAVTGYFVAIGTVFGFQGKKRAATAAFVNAGMVAGVSAFTDYEGTGKKPINFKLHGTLDAVQATTAALGPLLHGFADEPESAFFYGQAGNELAVISTTDWDQGMRRKRRRKAA
jgi:hypothetical protein